MYVQCNHATHLLPSAKLRNDTGASFYDCVTEIENVEKDFLGHLMSARDEVTGQGLSDKELRDQVMSLLLAGHEVLTGTHSPHLHTISTLSKFKTEAHKFSKALLKQLQ